MEPSESDSGSGFGADPRVSASLSAPPSPPSGSATADLDADTPGDAEPGVEDFEVPAGSTRRSRRGAFRRAASSPSSPARPPVGLLALLLVASTLVSGVFGSMLAAGVGSKNPAPQMPTPPAVAAPDVPGVVSEASESIATVLSADGIPVGTAVPVATGLYVVPSGAVAGAATMMLAARTVSVPATVVSADPVSGLSLLTAATTARPLPLRSGDVPVGEPVVVVAAPDAAPGSPASVSSPTAVASAGMVSAHGRRDAASQSPLDLVAAPSPPLAGGAAVLDAKGRLAGVALGLFAAAPAGFMLSVPSPAVEGLVSAYESGTAPAPVSGYMGVKLASSTPLDEPSGIPVTEVVPGSPAALAGITAKDRIVSVGGKLTPDTNAVMRAIAASPPGTQVEVVLNRPAEGGGFSSVVVPVVLGQRPPA